MSGGRPRRMMGSTQSAGPVFSAPLGLGTESWPRAPWHRAAPIQGRVKLSISLGGRAPHRRNRPCRNAGRSTPPGGGDRLVAHCWQQYYRPAAKYQPRPDTTPDIGATAVAGPAVGGWARPASGSRSCRFASTGSLNRGLLIAGQLKACLGGRAVWWDRSYTCGFGATAVGLSTTI